MTDSFDSRNGTYGARQPRPGRVMHWMNARIAKRVGKSGRGFGGMNALVVTTVGKKTGLERSNPVAWFPGDDGTWVIVASAGGGPRNPAWYYNIAANPDRVRIEVAGRSVEVSAIQLHGAERAEAWQRIVAAAPRFAKYETVTDRCIPLIRLSERAAPA